MKYTTARGVTISAIALGTVQLGMPYGLNRNFQKPTEEEAFALLDHAMELGIDNLDTANNYGDSEVIIGRWLNCRRSINKPLPFVVTKIGPLQHDSFDKLRDDILHQVNSCRENLGLDTLDCLMLHDFADYERNPDGIRQIFEELKRDGAYRISALSAYSRHDYRVIAESGFDAAQIPLNALDWTQIENGGLEALRQAEMLVYARSVFLQGLVFMTPDTLDPRMNFCIEPLQQYIGLCKDFNLSPAALALSFALSIPGISAVVLGCQNTNQVSENCALLDQSVQLTPQQLEMIHNSFRDIDPHVINPGYWFSSAK